MSPETMPPEAMPAGYAPPQGFPEMKQVQHNFVVGKATAGPASDKFRFIWQNPNKSETYREDSPLLEEGVEDKLVERYAREAMDDKQKAGDFDPKDYKDLNLFWAREKRKKTEADWAAMVDEVEAKLEKQINLFNSIAERSMVDFGKDINLMGRGNNSGMSAEVLAKFAGLIEEITQVKADVRIKIQEATAVAELLAKQETQAIIGLQQDLTGDTTIMPEATIRKLTRMYQNDQEVFQGGGVKRDAGHKVRAMRETAASSVRHKRSRMVEQGMLTIAQAHEKLQTVEKDSDEEAALNRIIAAKESDILPMLSDLTDTFEGRHENGPTGGEVVDENALRTTKMIHENRDDLGEINNTLYLTEATPHGVSWESAGRALDFILQTAWCHAAIQRLESTWQGPDSTGALVTKTGKAEFMNELGSTPVGIDSPLKKLTKEANDAETYLQTLLITKTTLEEKIEKADDDLEVLKTTADIAKDHFKKRQELETDKERKSSGGGGRQGQDPWTDASRRAQIAKQEHKAKEIELKRLKERLERVKDEIEPPIPPVGAPPAPEGAIAKRDRLKAAADAAALDPTLINPTEVAAYEAELTTAREKEYLSFLRRCKLFVDQEKRDSEKKSTEFTTLFHKADWRTFHELIGADLKHSLNEDGTVNYDRVDGVELKRIWTGNMTRSDGTLFQSDYAAVNLWAVPEFKGRASSQTIQTMLRDKGRYPELAQIKKSAETPPGAALGPGDLPPKRKALIGYGFAVNPDVSGGITRPDGDTGPGYGLDPAKVAELKARYHGNTYETYKAWLDDLHVQYDMGVRPEEVESRMFYHTAKDYILRAEQFPAKGNPEDWTYLKQEVITEELDNFNGLLEVMRSLGLPIRSQSLEHPAIKNYLLRTNEWKWSIVRDGQNMRLTGTPGTQMSEIFRDTDLMEHNTQADDLVERFGLSLLSRLELYERHALIGNQSPTRLDGPPTQKQIENAGAFMLGYCTYVMEQKAKVEGILHPVPGSAGVALTTPLAKLKALVELHEHDLAGMTYDVVDRDRPLKDDGGLNVINLKEEMRDKITRYYTVQGKFGSVLRERRLAYANDQNNHEAWTRPVPNTKLPSTGVNAKGTKLYPAIMWHNPETGLYERKTALDHSREQYEEAVQGDTMHKTLITFLGRQLLDQIPVNTGDSDRYIAEAVMGHYSDAIVDHIVTTAESMFDAVHGFNTTNSSNWAPMRRFKGWLDMCWVTQTVRTELNAKMLKFIDLPGNVLLRKLDTMVLGPITEDRPHDKGVFERYKFAGLVEWFLAARLAHAIHTGNQRGFMTIFFPDKSTRIVSAAAKKPGLQLGDETKTLAAILKDVMRNEAADMDDRNIFSEQTLAQKPLKELGVNLFWLLNERLTKATIPDDQFITTRDGGGMFGQTKYDLHKTAKDGGPIGEAHEQSKDSLKQSTLPQVFPKMLRFIEKCKGRNQGPMGNGIWRAVFGSQGEWQRVHGRATLSSPSDNDTAAVEDRPFNQANP